MKKPTTLLASKRVLLLLKKRELTLSLAESCTGGLLSSILTQHAGVSDVFLGAVISYSNASKIEFLGVSQRAIKQLGAVSLPVAAQMCLGAKERFESDVAIAITGIAGPSGGTKAKPVGTVCFAVHFRGETLLQQIHFSGSRVRIQTAAALEALKLVASVVSKGR